MAIKSRYPRAYSYYIPVSDENYERALSLRNTGLTEAIWSIKRQVAIHIIGIDKSRMAFGNDIELGYAENIVEHFDRFQWQPICLDHEGYLLDGQHRLEVCRRKGLFFMDAIVQCADHERIWRDTEERIAQEKRDRKNKRKDPLGDWLTRKEWKERYGTTLCFGENW